MRTVIARRYVTPLREGGSLPALIEADDGRLYVLKFRGAGQGPKALVAEWIAGELARLLGLRVPELVLLRLDPVLGRNEPDPEIQDLLKASGGDNLGLAYLPGALGFDPLSPPEVEPMLASEIVWFDSLVLNVDRTAKNPNLLVWNQALWLIDHGASLYFHHSWQGAASRPQALFSQIKDHVLLSRASQLDSANLALQKRLTPSAVSAVVAQVPESWLDAEPGVGGAPELKTLYTRWILDRLQAASLFTAEAVRARAELV